MGLPAENSETPLGGSRPASAKASAATSTPHSCCSANGYNFVTSFYKNIKPMKLPVYQFGGMKTQSSWR